MSHYLFSNSRVLLKVNNFPHESKWFVAQNSGDMIVVPKKLNVFLGKSFVLKVHVDGRNAKGSD